MIEREVPDYQDRIFYLSGPDALVKAFEITLRDMGIPSHQIKTDFFPGFM
jgi:ferredoxin-NADP reductase